MTDTSEAATVFLVPGFFGFTSLAGIEYFAQVRRVLQSALEDGGLQARIVGVKTFPTASLQRRARRLAETIKTEAPQGPVHVIGHSTGGLDARIIASPGAGADTDMELFSQIRQQIRSVTTVATPHRGTPMADFFDSIRGGQLLKLLSLLAVHATKVGPVPLHVIAALPKIIDGDLDELGPDGRVLGDIYGLLLKDFDPQSRGVLSNFLDEMAGDQSLISQLRPSSMSRLAQDWTLAPHIRGGSVITQARRPSVKAVVGLGFDPSAHLLHLLFRWLQRLSGGSFQLSAQTLASLRDGFGELHEAGNDGVVPTTSQSWEQPLAYTWADHLDVVGHFSGPSLSPPHYDWLPSGSQFRRPEFIRIWHAVADFICTSQSLDRSS